MATHGQGKGKRPVNVLIDDEVKMELQRLADESKMTMHEYCVTILRHAAASGTVVEKTESDVLRATKHKFTPARELTVRFGGETSFRSSNAAAAVQAAVSETVKKKS